MTEKYILKNKEQSENTKELEAKTLCTIINLSKNGTKLHNIYRLNGEQSIQECLKYLKRQKVKFASAFDAEISIATVSDGPPTNQIYTHSESDKLYATSKILSQTYYKVNKTMSDPKIFYPKYGFRARVGEGAHGNVDLVELYKTGKLYLRKMLNHHTSDSLDEELVLLKQAAKKGGSRYIVKLEDFGQHEISKNAYLIFEYSGPQAADLKRSKNLNFKSKCKITFDTISAIIFLHNLNIAHHDLKYDNIVWDGKRAFLIDLGLACNRDIACINDLPEGYASPLARYHIEMYGRYKKMSIEMSMQNDWYGLGVVLFRLWRGRRLKTGEQNTSGFEKRLAKSLKKDNIDLAESDTIKLAHLITSLLVDYADTPVITTVTDEFIFDP